MVETGQFKNFDSIPSTNEYCIELLSKSNPKPFTVISADYQTGGVGQIGSKWVSAPSENVLMSIIVYPHHINVSESFKLHFIASLSCVEVLRTFVEESRIHVKWPNDILVDYKKIAGILIRNTFMGSSIRNSVIGIGLNVNQLNFEPLQVPVTSIRDSTDSVQSVPDIRRMLYEKFRKLYDHLEKGTSLKEWYLTMLYGYNELFSFYDMKDRTYKRGEIMNVQGNGELIVQVGKEQEKYDFKEIKFMQHE